MAEALTSVHELLVKLSCRWLLCSKRVTPANSWRRSGVNRCMCGILLMDKLQWVSYHAHCISDRIQLLDWLWHAIKSKAVSWWQKPPVEGYKETSKRKTIKLYMLVCWPLKKELAILNLSLWGRASLVSDGHYGSSMPLFAISHSLSHTVFLTQSFPACISWHTSCNIIINF